MNKPNNIDDVFDLFVAKELSYEEVFTQIGSKHSDEVKAQLELHVAATRAIKRFAIQQQVADIHKMYVPKTILQSTPHIAPVKTIPAKGIAKWAMRIAASITLIIGLYAAQYALFFSPEKMFDSSFQEYSVNTERSSAAVKENEIATAFRKEDYNSVLSLYNGQLQKSNKEKFLAGYASLELNNFTQAETLFLEILETNKSEGSEYFQDEAEYYLAMVQLKQGKTESALKLMQQIHSNKEHTYNESISDWMIFRAKWY